MQNFWHSCNLLRFSPSVSSPSNLHTKVIWSIVIWFYRNFIGKALKISISTSVYPFHFYIQFRPIEYSKSISFLTEQYCQIRKRFQTGWATQRKGPPESQTVRNNNSPVLRKRQEAGGVLFIASRFRTIKYDMIKASLGYLNFRSVLRLFSLIFRAIHHNKNLQGIPLLCNYASEKPVVV